MVDGMAVYAAMAVRHLAGHLPPSATEQSPADLIAHRPDRQALDERRLTERSSSGAEACGGRGAG